MARYPDLTRQIHQLEAVLQNSNDVEKQRLLHKWLEQLGQVNEEIKHLEKIEKFAERVSKD